jgi:hypothetical protein
MYIGTVLSLLHVEICAKLVQRGEAFISCLVDGAVEVISIKCSVGGFAVEITQ